MKILLVFLSITSSRLYAESEDRVISIREPIPFSAEKVEVIGRKIEKRGKKVVDKRSKLKFATEAVKAEIFKPRLPFVTPQAASPITLSQPIVPKVLKD